MMQRAIDRSVQTGGSFLASGIVHGLLLLLLTWLVGRAAIDRLAGDELTHIAYIEARYGEDVAEKVKLKELASAKPTPAPPGPGIMTDSALHRAKPAAADPTPPVPDRAPQQPRLAPAPPPPVAVPQPQAPRPQLATAAAPAVAPAATAAPRELAQAAQLEARTAPAPGRQLVDTERLARSLAGELSADRAQAPRPTAPTSGEAFRPQRSGLQDRGGRAQVGAEPPVAAVTTGAQRSRADSIAEGAANLGGGSLTARTPAAEAYSPPASGLAPAGAARGGTGPAGQIVDVTGPSGDGAGQRSGRKTILDYGSGGGGGGGLQGRGRIAEPATRDIAAAATGAVAASEPAPRLAEAKLEGGQGVGMTISGQIAGRRILASVPPQYSERARREGWEGVVAVRFTVLPDGRVKDNVLLEQTSVHRDLNQAALAAIRQFLFAPLAADQGAIEQWGVITIVFRLH